MKTFDYKITDSLGIHARPAGLLVKASEGFRSQIFIIAKDKKADARRLFSIMSLQIKMGDTVTIEIIGDDEDLAYEKLTEFFKNNL